MMKMSANNQTVRGAPRADGRYDLERAATSLSAEGIPETPDGLGLHGVDPPAASSSARPAVGPSGIAVDGSGGMSYEGLPVTMSADGTPRVHVSAGAMTIETLRSMAIDLEYERLLAASRARMRGA